MSCIEIKVPSSRESLVACRYLSLPILEDHSARFTEEKTSKLPRGYLIHFKRNCKSRQYIIVEINAI